MLCVAIAVTYYLMPLWTLAIVVPVVAFVSSFVTVAIVAGIKLMLIGKFGRSW